MINFFNNNSDKFILCGASEVGLYELKKKEHETDFIYDNPKLQIINNLKFISQLEDSAIAFLTSEKRYQYQIKCAAPSYHQDELILGVGQTSGKVSILNFYPSSENFLEFTPRQNRPCLSLAWNLAEPNLLAMGFEKSKFDHCVTVWDVGKGAPSETSIAHLIGLSETCHSMCWEKKTLIAGMSQKYIKMFDLRQNPTTAMINTRAVNGVSISPNSKYLISYYDNVVHLYDMRKLTEPLNHFQLQNHLSQISWCPTSSNYLMCLQKDSSRSVNIIDIHWTGSNEAEGNEGAHFIKRTVAPFEIVDRKNRLQLQNGKNTVMSVCWHPHKPNHMMSVANSNNSLLLMELQVPERTIAIFDKWNKLWSPTVNEIREIPPLVSPPSSPTDSTNSWFPMDGDLAELFQQRIKQDYGLLAELEKNAKTCMDPSLQRVWRLLGQMQKADCFIGLRTILGIVPNSDELTIAQSSHETKTFSDFPSSGSIRLYRSEERDFAQELCGWTFHKGPGEVSVNLQAYNDELCKKKKFTRAAMLATFHLRIRMAIEILGKGADDNDDEKSSLRMSAIALAGFSTGTLWKSQCVAAQKQIEDPHLRAIFNFLADETYSGVLYEDGISLSDRMAFACAFLNDRQLSEYVKFMILNSIERGDLNGLLVTGATLDGIQLLQAFVDRTDDVQTAALIGSKIMPPDLQTDNRIQSWILSLRNMMNIWQLWEKRANFDVSLQTAMKTSPKSPKSVYLLCSFCGKSVSATLQEDARLRQTQGNKLSSCPNCRKPLPRCSLCLLHLGTSSVSGFYNPVGIKSKPFQKWFSWCQTCRHGGHTEHLASWFKTHTECPVTCCNCKCFAIDLPLLKEQEKQEVH